MTLFAGFWCGFIEQHGLTIYFALQGMALRAVHLFMHAAKREPRGIVIEFGDGADRRPAGGSVAILAREVQRTVRTLARLPLGIGRTRECQR